MSNIKDGVHLMAEAIREEEREKRERLEAETKDKLLKDAVTQFAPPKDANANNDTDGDDEDNGDDEENI